MIKPVEQAPACGALLKNAKSVSNLTSQSPQNIYNELQAGTCPTGCEPSN